MSEKSPADSTPLPPHPKRLRLFLMGGLIFALTLAFLVFMTLKRRNRTERQAAVAQRTERRGQKVMVTEVRRAHPRRRVELIGETRPFLTTPIYGRVSGYLVEMRVDKGDKVKEGQVLARIESPETDKAFLSALADWENKDRIAKREQVLRARRLISQQESDQAVFTADIAKATLETQKVLKGYETVTAPFDGTITARYADPGALIQNATNAQSVAQVLLNISTIERLRVYFYPDQADASYVHPGVEAEITMPGNPDFKVTAPVARTADELDPRTRTLLTEVDLDNPTRSLVPGSFVTVALDIPVASFLEVPVKSLVTRDKKPVVPIVAPDSTIHYREVKPGENTGQTVRILAGLREGEKVAVNIGESIIEGQKVQTEPYNLAQQSSLAATAEKEAASGPQSQAGQAGQGGTSAPGGSSQGQ